MRKINHYLFITLCLGLFYSCQVRENSEVVNVRDFGAKGDGTTNDQKAIQAAINSLSDAGGTVVFDEGGFLTGQIKLVDNLTIEIKPTAKILGIQSDAEEHYPHGIIKTEFRNRMEEDCQRRLIYGDHVKNITITGGGKIDGQGSFEPWMNVKELGTEKDRPSILAFVGSENITVSDIAMVNPACWTQVYIESKNVTVRNITVHTGNLTPNRDGIDIVDCHNVLIEDCLIQSEDDGICFKSGSEFGVKDVVVRNCVIDKLNVPAGNCFKLGTDGLGSFMDFEISGLTLKNAFQNSAIAIESMDGAVIYNLGFRDIEIENCGQAFFVLLADRKRTVPGRLKRIGAISNVSFKDIKGSGFTQQYPSIISGIPGHNIQNISFENVDLILKGGIQTTGQSVMEYDGKYPEGSKFGVTNAYAYFVRHVDQVSFNNCTTKTDQADARPWLAQEDVRKIIINP